KTVSEQEFFYMLDEYYRIRGWDKEGSPEKIPEFLG
ncbi:hypothetical protein DRJ04_00900, partial [Candidatus Aerophobetes bacterium]